uniref:Fungal lipase-type domain-containing protein n=1 Tax=Alexandrium monilatum TaxID=311494 RepID=A0A7S4RPF0_9DINO
MASVGEEDKAASEAAPEEEAAASEEGDREDASVADREVLSDSEADEVDALGQEVAEVETALAQEDGVENARSSLCEDVARLGHLVFAYHLCIFAAFLCTVMISLTLHLLSASVLSQGDVPPADRLKVLAYTTVVLASVYHNLLPLASAMDELLGDAFSFSDPQFPALRAQLHALQQPTMTGAAPAWAATPLFMVFCFLDPGVASLDSAARASGIHWLFLAYLVALGGLACLAARGWLAAPCEGPLEVATAVLERSKAVVGFVLLVFLVVGSITFDGGVYQSFARLAMFSVFLPALHLLAYLLVPLLHVGLSAWANAQDLERSLAALAWGTLLLSALPFWFALWLPDVFEGRLPNMLLLFSAVRLFIGLRMPSTHAHSRHSLSLQGFLKLLMLMLPFVVLLLGWALAQQHLGAIVRGVSGRVRRDASGGTLEIEQFLMNTSLHLAHGRGSSSGGVPTRGCQKAAPAACGQWRGAPYGEGSTRENSRYALCDMEWGGLRLLDFAILSQLAYFDWDRHRGFLHEALPLLFDGTTGVPRIVEGQGLAKHGGTRGGGAMAKFYQFDFDQLRLSVVAIRGTDPLDALDILQDLRLWAEPALTSLLSKLLPTIVLWPDGIIAEFVKWVHRLQGLFQTKQTLDYFGPLESAITEQLARKNRAEGWRFLVTGHSLGGGLAGIVGAHLQLPAIAFSPPGLMWSRMKFVGSLTDAARKAERELDSLGAADGIVRTPSSDGKGQKHVRLRDLAEFSIAVLPTRDPVPLFDKHFGLVQHTICFRSNPLLCHIPGSILCDLLARCGDAGRSRFQGCSTEASVSTMLRLFS